MSIIADDGYIFMTNEEDFIEMIKSLSSRKKLRLGRKKFNLVGGAFEMSQAHFEMLAKELEKNTSLTELSEHNQEHHILILKALESNSTLRKLDLSCSSTYLSQMEILKALQKILHVNSLLRSLTFSISKAFSIFKEKEEEIELFEKILSENTTLEELRLTEADFHAGLNPILNTWKLEESLCKALFVNTSLTILDIQCMFIGDKGIGILANALYENFSLQTLNLGNNHISEQGVLEIVNVLKKNSTLTKLNLRCNRIRNQGAIYLSEVLSNNCSLRCLNVGYNGIENDGIIILANAFKSNYNVTELTLGCNPFRIEGLTAIADTLETNSIIISLDLSLYNDILEKDVQFQKIDNYMQRNISKYQKTLKNIQILFYIFNPILNEEMFSRIFRNYSK